MAALQVQQDSGGRLVIKSPAIPSIGNLFSILVWLAILAVFFLPALQGDRIDWSNLLLILFFSVVTVGGSLLGAVTRTNVILDSASRTLVGSRLLLGFPLSSTQVPYGDLASIDYDYYRQASGRYSHDAWRVTAITRDGRRIPLNWDGKKDEMATLAQQVSNTTGAVLNDNSAKPSSTVQEILERVRGQRTDEGYPTAESNSEPLPTPDTFSPMPPAAEPPAAPPVTDSTSWVPPTAVDEQKPPTEPSMSWSTGTSSSASTPPADIWNLPVAELEKRTADDPMDSDARYALARKYQARGVPDKAIELYQQVLRLDPSDSGAQNDLGVALAQRGKRTEAEAALRRAIALDPFSSVSHLNLGLLLRANKRAAEASQEFYQARQNAEGEAMRRTAEAVSTGAKMDLQLSNK